MAQRQGKGVLAAQRKRWPAQQRFGRGRAIDAVPVQRKGDRQGVFEAHIDLVPAAKMPDGVGCWREQ